MNATVFSKMYTNGLNFILFNIFIDVSLFVSSFIFNLNFKKYVYFF